MCRVSHEANLWIPNDLAQPLTQFLLWIACHLTLNKDTHHLIKHDVYSFDFLFLVSKYTGDGQERPSILLNYAYRLPLSHKLSQSWSEHGLIWQNMHNAGGRFQHCYHAQVPLTKEVIWFCFEFKAHTGKNLTIGLSYRKATGRKFSTHIQGST